MNRRQNWMIIILMIVFCPVYGQKGKLSNYFDNPIVVDSASTIIIPTLYHSEFLSTNKIALWGDFYANIIFYNFTTDAYKSLFEKDTYIVGFNNPYAYRSDSKKPSNITAQWLFYRVKNVDRNKNGRIDNADPAILYVSDLSGNNLKALTAENENIVGIDVFEKQNFALIKVQRDHENDGNFKAEDKDFYYIKLDLNHLTFGNKIEIK